MISNHTEELNIELSTMNLPVNKKDCSKPETLKWLLQNLSKRNSQHPSYVKVKHKLTEIAKEQHLLKTKELRRL
jgi:hypothetical protein